MQWRSQGSWPLRCGAESRDKGGSGPSLPLGNRVLFPGVAPAPRAPASPSPPLPAVSPPALAVTLASGCFVSREKRCILLLCCVRQSLGTFPLCLKLPTVSRGKPPPHATRSDDAKLFLLLTLLAVVTSCPSQAPLCRGPRAVSPRRAVTLFFLICKRNRGSRCSERGGAWPRGREPTLGLLRFWWPRDQQRPRRLGWRLGPVRRPDSPLSRQLHSRGEHRQLLRDRKSVV